MRRIVSLPLFLILSALGGCLEFDAQQITMRYDVQRDRIDALIVYRGLFAENNTVSSSANPVGVALADLQKVLDRGQAFFWCNWPLAIDLVESDAATAELAMHVEVEHGGLYTDPMGVLNGYQFLRVVRVGEFVRKLNTMLELLVQGAMMGGFRGIEFDRDTREIVTEFLREGKKMVVIEPGRVELRLPLSKRDFQKVVAAMEDHFLSHLHTELTRLADVQPVEAADDGETAAVESSDADNGDFELAKNGQPRLLFAAGELQDGVRSSPTMRFFWDNEFTIERGQELHTIGIGARGNEELQLTKASGGLYSDNFLKALRERGDEIEEGVPDQEIRRRFDEFLTREAVIPEALRAKREQR